MLVDAARIVVAGDVHPSSETAVTDGLIEAAARHGRIDTLLADAGFNSAGMIETTDKHRIELLAPEGRTEPGEVDTAKRSDTRIVKAQFTYDAASDSYRCPAGHGLALQQTTRQHKLYGGAPRSDCPLKAKCTTSETGRTIKRLPSDAAKEAMRAKLREPEHRQRYNRRAGMVEPLFAHLKVEQGLCRFRRRGLAKVRLEFKLHLAACNLSRAVALVCTYLAAIWRALGGPMQRWRDSEASRVPALTARLGLPTPLRRSDRRSGMLTSV